MQITDAGFQNVEAACRMPYDHLVLFNLINGAVNRSVNEHQKKELDRIKKENARS